MINFEKRQALSGEKTSDVVPIRNEKGHFTKGQSGNPLGGKLAKVNRSRLTVDQLIEENAVKVVEMLIQTILSPDTAAGPRVSAIKEFNDRFSGKSVQGHVIKREDDEAAAIDMTDMDDETLRKLVAARVRKD